MISGIDFLSAADWGRLIGLPLLLQLRNSVINRTLSSQYTLTQRSIASVFDSDTGPSTIFHLIESVVSNIDKTSPTNSGNVYTPVI